MMNVENYLYGASKIIIIIKDDLHNFFFFWEGFIVINNGI